MLRLELLASLFILDCSTSAGKFGVQKDRQDSSAVGHDYVGKTEKHSSQKDYATGFGGKFGVQKDRQDEVRTSFIQSAIPLS